MLVSAGDRGSYVYDSDTLIGVITPQYWYPYWLAPAVVTPAGEEFPLPFASGRDEAVAAVTRAAAEYTYRPHPVTVAVRLAGRDRRARFGGWCPTCHEGGLPPLPCYDSEGEALRSATVDHHRVIGQPAERVEYPQPLPRPGPPTASPYYHLSRP